MKAPLVRLKLRVSLPSGARPYLNPVFAANGKLKPGYAYLDRVAVHYPGSVYHLRYLKSGKRVWEAVGSDAQLAVIAKLRREKTLEALAAGLAVVEEHGSTQRLTDLRDAVVEYLEETDAHKSRKTKSAYAHRPEAFSGGVP